MRLIVPVMALAMLLAACGGAGTASPPVTSPADPTALPTQPPAAAADSASAPSATVGAATPAPRLATSTAIQPLASPTTVVAESLAASATPTAMPPSVNTETPMPANTPPADESQPPQPAPTPPLRLPALVPPTPLPITGEATPLVLDQIIADVMQRSGAERQAVVILRDEAVTWPDGSLGCPQPGMAYPQVLIDGFWVVLRIGDTEYDYRADDRGRFILCEKPDRMPPVIDPTR